MRADLLTCYAGVPEHYRTDCGSVYRVGDHRGSKARRKLYSELKANGYRVIGIICAAQPIMTRWKWTVAARARWPASSRFHSRFCISSCSPQQSIYGGN
jgi:hypothetical protein